MKFIKLILISVVVFFVILTCLGLLLPSTVRVTRNIIIHSPQDTLFTYIADINKWRLWLQGADSAGIKIIDSVPGGDARAAIIGGQQVSIVKAGRSNIETRWQNSRGTYQLGMFQLVPDTAANTTNLNWYFEQKLKWYPWQRLPSIANDKILGPFMEHSLDQLKSITENSNH